MKKKEFHELEFRFMKKLFLTMKICLFLVLISAATSFANVSYSQNKLLTLNLHNTTIKELIRDIEDQSEFIFVFYDDALDLDRKISISANEQPVEKILEQVLGPTNNTFAIFDRQIVIGKKSSADLNIVDGLPELVQAEQKKSISGKISDAKGNPVVGATIVVKGTTLGTIADANGQFNVQVTPDAKILVVSFVGMKSQEIDIQNKSEVNVVLEDENVGLDEVVVVGYGTQKKESVVGAISQVDNKGLMKSGVPTVTNAITGKLSGVLTIQQTGEPGSNSSEIIIRGLSSWNGSAPLTLVDGVERDFKDLDPTEINTISVLKDASATAVYGAKGANGVILVTTKRGSLGKPQLSITASTGAEYATSIPDHISSYQTMQMLNVAKMNGQQFTDLIPQSALNEYKNPSSPLKALQYPDVNWFDELTHSFAPLVNANINLQGGTNFVKYFCALGYLYEGDLFKAYHNGYDDSRYKYNRFNYRANLDFALTKSTQLLVNVGGEVGIKNQPKDSPWYNLYATSPGRFPAYFPAWVLEQVPDLDYPDATGSRLAASFGEYSGNPYTSLYSGSFNKYLDSKLFTDITLNQDLDFITKGLSFKGKVSLSTYYKNRVLYADFSFPQYILDYSKIGVDENGDGIVDSNPWMRNGQGNEVYNMPPVDLNVGGLESGYYKDLYYEVSLNYKKSIGNHNISALALLNRQEKDYQTDFPYYNEALVGRATYDYSHKYLVEFNVGYTGSERFAPGNRFGFFPAAAFGWTVSEEPFFKTAVPWMNKLKFRYSDGLTGSDQAQNRWLYISDFYKDPAGYIREDKGANTTAQWEEARKRDFGTEIGLFKNQLSLSVDLFDEYRDKMLLTPRTVTFLVGNSFKDLNMGKLKKHGLEVEAEYNKTLSNGLNYYVKGLFGYNENRIIFEDDPVNTPEYLKNSGKPLGAQLEGVTLTGSGYYTSINDIHNNPAAISIDQLNVGDYKYLDYSADGIISSNDKHPIKGNLYPPITYSLSSGFSYKGWEFSFMFQGNFGKYVDYNQTFECEFIKGDYSVHASQLDYWTPSNQDANHATLHYSSGGNIANLLWGGGEAASGYSIRVQDRFWRKADYIRLKEIYLGYNFTSNVLKRYLAVSTLNVYATANNVLTFTSLIEGDPERKDFQQGFYPQMSSFNLGVKCSF